MKENYYQVMAGCAAAAKTDTPHSYENQGESILKFIMAVNEKAS